VAGIGPDDDDAEAAIGRPQEPARPGQNGATRMAITPPVPAAPAVVPAPPTNLSPLPHNPEETPEMTAARQRVRMLIDKYDHLIKTAPDAASLAASFDAGQQEIAEIEGAGDKGREAVRALRRKYLARMTQIGDQAA
jgi:hypothetical protein